MKVVYKKKVLIPGNNQSQSDVALNVARLFNNNINTHNNEKN